MRPLIMAFCFLLVSGCGVQSPLADSASYRVRMEKSDTSDSEVATYNSGIQAEGESESSIGGRTGMAGTAGAQGESDGLGRKIIYTASIQLVVNQFDGLEKNIQQAIKNCDGYLARVNLDRMQGENRSGTWTARIPTNRYDEFLETIADMGVPVSQEQDAQDVTEEFVDLTARIANQKKLEKRILELLDRPDDKIQHVIEVEKELARVRETIERMEGRLRFLSDKTDLTTVVISAREERDYQPPQTPSLDNRMATAWGTSFENTKTAFGNFLVNLAGSLIPILIGAVLLLAFWFLLGRRIWRSVSSRFASASTTLRNAGEIETTEATSS